MLPFCHLFAATFCTWQNSISTEFTHTVLMQPTFSRFMHICASEPFADVPEFTALIGGLIRWQHTVGLFKNYRNKK